MFRGNKGFPGLPEGIRTFSKPFWTNLGTFVFRPFFDSKRNLFRKDKLVLRKEVFGFSEKCCVSQRNVPFCLAILRLSASLDFRWPIRSIVEGPGPAPWPERSFSLLLNILNPYNILLLAALTRVHALPPRRKHHFCYKLSPRARQTTVRQMALFVAGSLLMRGRSDSDTSIIFIFSSFFTNLLPVYVKPWFL